MGDIDWDDARDIKIVIIGPANAGKTSMYMFLGLEILILYSDCEAYSSRGTGTSNISCFCWFAACLAFVVYLSCTIVRRQLFK